MIVYLIAKSGLEVIIVEQSIAKFDIKTGVVVYELMKQLS